MMYAMTQETFQWVTLILLALILVGVWLRPYIVR